MQFNLNEIIKNHGIDTNELASILFPSVKYQKLALDRILKGEASLSVVQLEKLASYLGVLPSSLFTNDNWIDVTEDEYLTLAKGQFKVKLNYNGSFLTLYKNNEVIDTKVVNISALSVNDFIDYINELITNY